MNLHFNSSLWPNFCGSLTHFIQLSHTKNQWALSSSTERSEESVAREALFLFITAWAEFHTHRKELSCKFIRFHRSSQCSRCVRAPTLKHFRREFMTLFRFRQQFSIKRLFLRRAQESFLGEIMAKVNSINLTEGVNSSTRLMIMRKKSFRRNFNTFPSQSRG